ncbi:DUF2971 domain-containing protein [Aeromonas caviae]
MKILQNGSVGFTQPCHFNDPFEVEAAYPSTEGSNPVDVMLNGIRNWGKKSVWKENTGILSLTRQPLNPLMWAHYGREHKGMVIGIDASITEFTCEETNLVPIQYGNVIYTNKKPDSPFLSKPTESIEVGGTFHFPKGQLERLQRMFLYKPACWAYEEEVRVAKCLKGIEDNSTIKSGTFTRIDADGRPLYLLNLPKNAIKEVYIGARSKLLDDASNSLDLMQEIRDYQPQINVYGCGISNKSWELVHFDLEDAAKKALQRTSRRMSR